jgi:hypothetical protein
MIPPYWGAVDSDKSVISTQQSGVDFLSPSIIISKGIICPLNSLLKFALEVTKNFVPQKKWKEIDKLVFRI